MSEIIVSLTVSADRRISFELPPEIPLGEIELIIRSKDLTQRENIRAKLEAAGVLSTVHEPPTKTHRLSVEERLQLGTLPPNARPSEALIDEERGCLSQINSTG